MPQRTMDQQVRTDAAAGAFDDWGLSTVIDENLDAPVIPRDQFERLHDLAGLDAAWPIGNAGLLHVYGYLLSTVDTPYGSKGARWLDGTLARTLGLPADAFLPDGPGIGTLLSRVTAAVLPRLAEPPVDALAVLDQQSMDGRATVRTVVVGGAHAAALLYGIAEGGRMRAVTAFPLSAAPDSFLRALAEQQPRLRYNAATSTLAPRSPLASSLRTQ
ncbi:amino acid deaminase [Lacisediminihabitans profunda]|uniref:Amino acid deaminase n=1 Tax=Lacisediminihabitans profunda TaxID=2594790 RepID=A0A5C8UUX3_9MICO|nr:amino acid deaminase [Lacisediminihabitans profunda]TXN31398.1 amino acid deaminase [Lacisediminihabitans profunda]